ncbi:MAG TPA: hypothetical protein QF730_10920 [Planctomycetota bacterium]|jgi:hypothetical protein|nr:hypothetical protein [Planctomycetota bacterium]
MHLFKNRHLITGVLLACTLITLGLCLVDRPGSSEGHEEEAVLVAGRMISEGVTIVGGSSPARSNPPA